MILILNAFLKACLIAVVFAESEAKADAALFYKGYGYAAPFPYSVYHGYSCTYGSFPFVHPYIHCLGKRSAVAWPAPESKADGISALFYRGHRYAAPYTNSGFHGYAGYSYNNLYRIL